MEFRDRNGLSDPNNVHGKRGWFPIHFIGVWDTVEAYGLPIDEMADAFYWWFPLRFQRRGALRENDLHPLIRNARHALAVDDERHSFHPKPWIEDRPYKPGTDERIPGGEAVKFPGLAPVEGQNVQQVWFPGMHSNVGGGYPKDQMAHVSLVWMMDEARKCGLVCDAHLRAQYAQAADALGKMYDSRSGFGAYYRYRPRDLHMLCAESGIRKPTIHASVFERIQRHTEDYAPTGIPTDYEVVDAPPGSAPEPNPAARMDRQHRVDELIWKGRVLYLLLVAWSISLFGTAWSLASERGESPDIEHWCRWTRVAYSSLAPIMKLVTWVTPAYFEPGVIGLGQHPWVLATLVIVGGVILNRRSAVTRAIWKQSNAAWRLGYNRNATVSAPRLFPVAKQLRESAWSNQLADWFHGWVLPKLLILAIILAIVIVLWRWIPTPWTEFVRVTVTADNLATNDRSPFVFDTVQPFQATPFLLNAGEVYGIELTEQPESGAPWFDAGLPASADGLRDAPPSALQFGGFARRMADEPWFKVLGAIGSTEAEPFAIGRGRVLVAPSSGRLYLFVNDAHGFYGNNHGKATVTVKRLSKI